MVAISIVRIQCYLYSTRKTPASTFNERCWVTQHSPRPWLDSTARSLHSNYWNGTTPSLHFHRWKSLHNSPPWSCPLCIVVEAGHWSLSHESFHSNVSVTEDCDGTRASTCRNLLHRSTLNLSWHDGSPCGRHDREMELLWKKVSRKWDASYCALTKSETLSCQQRLGCNIEARTYLKCIRWLYSLFFSHRARRQRSKWKRCTVL